MMLSRLSASIHVHQRLFPACVVMLVAGLPACSDPTAPARPPYLAIVVKLDAPPGVNPGSQYTYHVDELSGTLHINKVVTAAPTDTVIIPLPAATYSVTLEGVPANCAAKDGPEQLVYLLPSSNTSIARYFITCKAIVTVQTLTDGPNADDDFIYHIVAADGSQRNGLLHGNDEIRLAGMAPGDGMIELADVAPNCVVTSDGGEVRSIRVDSMGGASVAFRVMCADPVHRPTLLEFHPSYHGGVGGVLFRATDPDHDIERYSWDLTDCRRHSVLPGGPRLRRGLSTGRTAAADTVLILGTFEVGLPDDSLAGKCAAIWVADQAGSLTAVFEAPLMGADNHAPNAVTFNARFRGTQSLDVSLSTSDPDGDFVGFFGTVRLRDGTLGSPDGTLDLGLYNYMGYLGSQVPPVPLGNGSITFDNFYAVILDLFDAQGNFTRIEDADLFQ